MQNTFERREKKVLVDEEIFPEIEKKILTHFVADKYNVGGKPYEICNIYFDDEYRSVTRHSVSKPEYKEKLRLRSYGTPTLSEDVFLEIKRKLAGIGTKRRACLSLFKMYEYLETGILPSFDTYIDGQVMREADYFIKSKSLKPSVYIGYMRNAYFDRDDPSLRLTVDRDIVTRYDDLHLESGRYGSPLLPNGKLLMEIKFSGATPLWLAHTLSEYGLSYVNYSKVGRDFMKETAEHAAEKDRDKNKAKTKAERIIL